MNKQIAFKPKFIKPIAITFGVIAILPLLTIIYYLIFKGGVESNSFTASTILSVFWNTIKLMIGTSIFATLIGTALSMLINKCKIPYKRAIEWFVVLPTVIPKFAFVLFILYTYNSSDGLIKLNFINGSGILNACLILGMALYPYVYIQVTEALKKQPKNIDEAALTLNSSKWEYATKIIVPTIIPAISSAVLVIMIYVINDYGSINLLQVNTLSTLVYIQFNSYYSTFHAIAISLIPLAMIISLIFIDLKFVKKAVKLNSTKNIGEHYQWKVNKWIPFTIIGLIISFIIIVPMGYLVVSGVKQIINNGLSSDLISATLNTLNVATLAGLLGVSIAFVMAYIRSFGNNKEKLLSRVSLVSYSISGITLGIIWIAFSINLFKPIYNTAIVLVIALAFKHLIHGQNVLTTTLENRPKTLEEASMVLGKTRTETFLNVTLLSSVPAIITAFTSIFAHVASDLNLTLILRPLGVEYLSTYIWTQKTHAFSMHAITPAILILILLSAMLYVVRGGVNYGKNIKAKKQID